MQLCQASSLAAGCRTETRREASPHAPEMQRQRKGGGEYALASAIPCLPHFAGPMPLPPGRPTHRLRRSQHSAAGFRQQLEALVLVKHDSDVCMARRVHNAMMALWAWPSSSSTAPSVLLPTTSHIVHTNKLTEVEHEEGTERDEGKPEEECRGVAAGLGLHVWQRPAAGMGVAAGRARAVGAAAAASAGWIPCLGSRRQEVPRLRLRAAGPAVLLTVTPS